MSHTVTLLPGDGIGPEVTNAMRMCVDATGVKINWEVHEVGEKSMQKYGKPLTDEVLDSIRRNKTAIKGPYHHPGRERFSFGQCPVAPVFGSVCLCASLSLL